jgi:hypothetical protein
MYMNITFYPPQKIELYNKLMTDFEYAYISYNDLRLEEILHKDGIFINRTKKEFIATTQNQYDQQLKHLYCIESKKCISLDYHSLGQPALLLQFIPYDDVKEELEERLTNPTHKENHFDDTPTNDIIFSFTFKDDLIYSVSLIDKYIVPTLKNVFSN